MAKLSEVQTAEFAGGPDASLEVVLQSIGEQFAAFKEAHPDAEFLGTTFIGPVKENDVWGASGLLFYKETI